MASTSSRDQHQPPNILLVCTDQQRSDALGIAGHPVLQTPTMDWIGAAGTRFRRGYAESPACIPARRVLMSGMAPHVNGMVGMEAGVPFDPPATMAGALRQAGYETRMIGKLHLHPVRKRFGFDAMELADSTRGGDNDYLDWLRGEQPPDRWAMAHGATPNGWIGRPNHLPEERTHTFWCVSRAIQFLERRDPTVPFFLNLSFIDPHPPFTPPRFFYDRYAAKELPGPVVGDWAEPWAGPRRGIDPEVRSEKRFYRRGMDLDPLPMHYMRAGYFGMINHIDMQLSRLFQYLGDRRLLNDALILFVSDHGEMLGDHYQIGKSYPFEASAGVPFLVKPPDEWRAPREQVCDQPVGLQDIMPTVLEAAGTAIPPSVTGRSVLPLLRGGEPPWRNTLHLEYATGGGGEEPEALPNDIVAAEQWAAGWHALVDTRHKYIWHSQTGTELLFDVREDPFERENLAAKQDLAPWRARLVAELRGRPEGFVAGDDLVVGQPHHKLVPGTAAAETVISPPTY
jgi:arylsulfatase